MGVKVPILTNILIYASVKCAQNLYCVLYIFIKITRSVSYANINTNNNLAF